MTNLLNFATSLPNIENYFEGPFLNKKIIILKSIFNELHKLRRQRTLGVLIQARINLAWNFYNRASSFSSQVLF